ncbi:integral membrane protein [Apodospora peruviana]|uniref:Integral membrane protein n=1 Tax=Apodospora peruviana TaxID=516989 RepID=A0AAE0HTL9_9PEZI|nr:integral membrane protein [Apodospora peruviana]
MSSETTFEDQASVPSLATAHGILMGLAFVVFMPIGAVLIRSIESKNALWIHASCQLTGLALVIAGLVTGVRLFQIKDQLDNNVHTVLGAVIAVGILLQPFIGYIHHRRYVRTQQRSNWSTIHVWFGRTLLLLGIVNGGLGLQLALGSPEYSEVGLIVYSVLAGVAGLLLLGLIAYVGKTKGNQGAKVDA